MLRHFLKGAKLASISAMILAAAPTLMADSLSTTANPASVTLGTSVVKLGDSATLSGGSNPSGNIIFTLDYGTIAVDTETVIVTGNGTYMTPTGFTLPTTGSVTGTYIWSAKYSGDPFNSGITAAPETVTVNPAMPTITSTPGGTIILGSSGVLTDSATLSGGYSPTGTMTFTLLSPSATPVESITIGVSGNGTYTTPSGYTPTSAGTYEWAVTYKGDANNDPAITSANSEPQVVTAAPEPSSLALLCAGVCCVFGLIRRKGA